jgi:hypothetical protein
MSGAFLIIAAASLSIGAAKGETKTFADWVAGCDNGLSCEAVSLMEMETTDNQLTMRIQRGPGRTAPAVLSIANIENRKPGTVLRLAVEGGAVLATQATPDNDSPIKFDFTPAFLNSLKTARYIELRGPDGKRLGHASLKGLTSAITHIDTLQKRAKTVTALADPGDGLATSIPVPPSIPKYRYTVPRFAKPAALSPQMVADMRKSSGCDALLQDAVAETLLIPVTKSSSLALLSCGEGVYNSSFVPFLITGKDKSRKFKYAPFDAAFDTLEGSQIPLLINPGWDSEKGILSSFNKGRGLGDCGNAQDYIWDGKQFRTINMTVMSDCRGVVDWVRIYTAKAEPKK